MANLEYEVMVKESFEIQNKELNKQMALIHNALTLGKKAQWDVVFAVCNIIEDELWEDDFDSQKDFAEYMNISNASISQYKGANKFLTATNYPSDNISVGNAYLLSSLITEIEDSEEMPYDLSEYLDFEEWCREKDIELMLLTQKSLRNVIAEFKSRFDAVDDAEDTEATDDAGETDTEDENVVIINNVKHVLTDEQFVAVMQLINSFNE